MRWAERTWQWKRRFAFLPVCVGGMCVWLEPYWSRPCGEGDEVRFTDPADAERSEVTASEGEVSPGTNS